MKKLFATYILCILCSVLNAQDITITFQSKVDTVSIDSIKATNLRTNQTVKLLEGESLLLVTTSTSSNQLRSNIDMGYIYPNPTDGDATISFSMDKSEEVEIRLYNSNGQLLSKEKEILSPGMNRFTIKFPVAGIYYINVIKRDETSGFKALYTGRNKQNISILYAGSENLNSSVSNENQIKSATTDISLAFTEGDRIQYSCFLGVNTTIISDEPSVSKTVFVEFVSCIDNDNRSYKTVQIGNQWWMAENLAYLPVVHPPSPGSYTEPLYYVYDFTGSDVDSAKQQANYTIFGVLYNWPAAKAACPAGWHLPTDAEWKQLEMAIGMSQSEADVIGWRGTNEGTKLKAISGWYNNGNGTNDFGFSALPGGARYNTGVFSSINNDNDIGAWWSSTEETSNYAWRRSLLYSNSNVNRYGARKEYGLSVCCVRD